MYMLIEVKIGDYVERKLVKVCEKPKPRYERQPLKAYMRVNW